jgi:hypothetical protein
VGSGIKLKGLVLNVPEPEVVVDEVEDCRIVSCVIYRPTKLDRYCAVEFIGRNLVVYINKDIAVDPFSVAENAVGPDGVVHELEDISLHVLKYLPVGSLDLLGRDLDIAVQLL